MEYVVNKKTKSKEKIYIIHRKNCNKLPKKENCTDLKECMCPLDAKNKAKELYGNVRGCKICCKGIF